MHGDFASVTNGLTSARLQGKDIFQSMQDRPLHLPVAPVPTVSRPWAGLAAALLGWLVLLAVFHGVPELDLAAARLFFEAQPCASPSQSALSCGIFPWSKSPALIGARMALYYLPHALALILLGLIIAEQRRAVSDKIFVRQALILLAGVLAGPVLLVNGILKTFSGRPRPYESADFGGLLDFVAAGNFTGACLRNCSFISGEASGAGWVFCLIVLLPFWLRWKAGLPILVLTIFATLLRVVFGGHYLSDALLGWLSSIIVCLVVAVIVGWPERARP